MTVRTRITVVAVAVVAAAVLIASVGFLVVLRSALYDAIDETADRRADEVGDLLAQDYTDRRLPVPVEEDEDDLLVQVLNRSGQVVAASPNALDHPPLSERRPEGDERLLATVDGLRIDPDDKFRLLAETVDTPAGPLTVFVATELKEFDKVVATVRRNVTAGAAALLVLIGTLTWVLLGRALRPVESIRSQVAEISGRALDRRVPEPAVNDEVGRLARTMNAMLDRLQASNERQARFSADVSHELRSPLASVRAQLEVAAAHPGLTTVEDLASDLLSENERMEQMVDDLLLLTRAEGTEEVPTEPVDLDELVLAEVARLRPRTGVQFEISRLSAGRTRGDAEGLRRVVRNLLENAARHAESAVEVSLRPDGDEVELVVADDGPGIPPADRERVFDRFTRLDGARSRHQGGSGLGLAIVHETIAAHGGRIWVEEADGARFVVRLPDGVEPAQG
ncbi:MAG: sensor histidine kinase [Acidimicrobiia bacterium]